MFGWIGQNLLTLVTVIAMLLGGVIGTVLRKTNPSADVILLVSFPGHILIRILKMLTLPLVISSLIAGKAPLLDM